MPTDPIPRTMQAVVYRGVNDLCVETVPVPRCGAHEVLVLSLIHISEPRDATLSRMPSSA